MKRTLGSGCAVLLLVYGVLSAILSSQKIYLLEAPVKLLIGWLLFLRDVRGRVTLSWSAIASALAAAAVLGVGGHFFARWLSRQTKGDPAAPWPWRWSLAGLLGLVLLFVVGMGTLGVVHQLGWLFREERLTEKRWRFSSFNEVSKRAERVCYEVGSVLEHGERLPEFLYDEGGFFALERTLGDGRREFLLVPYDPMKRAGGVYSCLDGVESVIPDELVSARLAEFQAASAPPPTQPPAPPMTPSAVPGPD